MRVKGGATVRRRALRLLDALAVGELEGVRAYAGQHLGMHRLGYRGELRDAAPTLAAVARPPDFAVGHACE